MYGVLITLSMVLSSSSWPTQRRAISPSSKYKTSLVYSTIGLASEAIKYSPSLMPITKGDPFFATIISSGLSLEITPIAYAPTTSFRANLTASNKLKLS